MQSFRSQDMQKQAAAVQEAAMKEPVLITYHDRPRLVVMSIEDFDRLRARHGAAGGSSRSGTASAPNRTKRDFLIAYSRGEVSRNEAMDAVGVDRSEVAEFARLMNSDRIPWPKVDRQQAEGEADGLLAMLDGDLV
jgi:prevent-host-death family protein